MSARNGDKARFGKQKKRRMAQRLKVRAMREDLKAAAVGENHAAVAAEGSGAEAEQGEHLSEHAGSEHAGSEHAGVLSSAAQKIGAALGSLAAKTERVQQPEPAHAE